MSVVTVKYFKRQFQQLQGIYFQRNNELQGIYF